MVKEFIALITTKNGNKIERREGDYDAKDGVYYRKTDNGWTATDEYTGRLLVYDKPTKKACQDGVKELMSQLKKAREGEKYLQSVINFNELIEDEG